MNGKPTGFVGFINQIQMVALAGLNGQVVWLIGSVVLTLVDAYLLTRRATEIPLDKLLLAAGNSINVATYQMNVSASISLFLAHNTGAEQMRQVGLWLAGFLLTGWTGKSISNRFANKDVRETAQEYVRAKAEGEATARIVTQDHPAVQAHHVDQMVVKADSVPVNDKVPDNEWANGDPRAGVL